MKGDWNNSAIINEHFHVGCRDGKMCPLIIQREGKIPMGLNDFLRGFIFEINSKINV